MQNTKQHLTTDQLSLINLEKLPADGGGEFNRLIFEKSPYLLQHATNPIDWRPWTDATLKLAREVNKPIFLSIGYSTCHWCHVMAEESFSDHHVASLLNLDYIPIKVDREERPDIDATYMQACQLMIGSGGWPLTLILTPELLPFFAATYIPKNDRQNMIGLITLLNRVSALWQEDRERMLSSGRQILETLSKNEVSTGSRVLPDQDFFPQVIKQYQNQFDPLFGGFGPAPKFPAPHNLSFLIRTGHRLYDSTVTDMALDTLRAIRFGGVYDQLGGGIHRYSVDERWLVPHFEKMLYDQALLIIACTDAWQASGDDFFRQMAEDIAEYIIRDLTAPDGNFYCGEDADSEGEEGTFYVWTIKELETHFSGQELQQVVNLFGLSAKGNFEGKNILYLPEGVDNDLIQFSRAKLLPVRNQRPRPHRDDKSITAWNGLTIAALARLGALTGNRRLLKFAGQSAAFIKGNLCARNGRLLRRWRQQDAAIPGFLEDYAFMIWGLLELYQSRFHTEDLQWALQLTDAMIALFNDGEGGLHDTGHDAEKILIRGRNLQDGALPSGNGTAAMVLIRLGTLTGREDLRRQGEMVLKKNWAVISRYPSAFTMSLTAFDYLIGPSSSLVLAFEGEKPVAFLDEVYSHYLPRLELLLSNQADTALATLAPLAVGKTTKKNRATAWLCHAQSCKEAVTNRAELAIHLQNLAKTND